MGSKDPLYKQPALFSCKTAISSIKINSKEPYYFSVVSSANVFFFTHKNFKIKSKIITQRNIFLNGDFRPNDAKLFAVSGKNGKIEIIDFYKNKLLRTFSAHKDPINDICFSQNNVDLISGSDDRTVRVWDISNQKCLALFGNHENSVSCVSYFPNNKNLIVSSSYDGKLRIFDLRQKKLVVSLFDHKSPIEKFKISKSGKFITTQGGSRIKFWILDFKKEFLDIKEQKPFLTFDFLTNYSLVYGNLNGEIKKIDLLRRKIFSIFIYQKPVILLGSRNENILIAFSNGQICLRRFFEKNYKKSYYNGKTIKNGSKENLNYHKDSSSHYFFFPEKKKKQSHIKKNWQTLGNRGKFSKKNLETKKTKNPQISLNLFFLSNFDKFSSYELKSYILLIFLNFMEKNNILQNLCQKKNFNIAEFILTSIKRDLKILSYKDIFLILKKIVTINHLHFPDKLSFNFTKGIIIWSKKMQVKFDLKIIFQTITDFWDIF